MATTPGRFRIVVIGAGMAGLGAALALARNGYAVTVFESDDSLNETGGGLQLSPNCTRILHHYGLTNELSNHAMCLETIKFRRYASGDIIGQTNLIPQMTENFDFPYWLVRRADLQQILYDGAIRARVEVLFGQTMAEIKNMHGRQVVVLENGEQYDADLVIGADGIRSKCRKYLFPDSTLDPIPTDSCAYRAVVSTAKVKENSVTRHLLNTTDSNAWLGPHRQLLGYPIRGGQDFNLVGIHLGRVADTQKSSEMVEDLDGMRQDFQDFDPVVQELLKMVDSAQRWQLQNVPALHGWRSQSGRCVLIGDAAHAMVPFLAQGASSAIEDGAALAECLATCDLSDDAIANAVKMFTDIRMERIDKLREGAFYNEKMLHLPDGPEQIKRDREMMPMEDGKSSNLWSDHDFSEWLFGYDAVEDVNPYPLLGGVLQNTDMLISFHRHAIV